MMRRIKKLERTVEAVNWTGQLPDGITVAEAEAFLETWARLAADYANAHGVSIETAGNLALGQAVALARSGDLAEEDDE